MADAANANTLSGTHCCICGKLCGTPYPGAKVYCWECIYKDTEPIRQRLIAKGLVKPPQVVASK